MAKDKSAWYDGRTVDGHNVPEASSALQKAVRRSDPDSAVYWALQLYRTGYGRYVWKRLKIMVSEDVGLANPLLPAQVQALYQMWLDQTVQKNDSPSQAQLFIVHAVLLVAMSQKSRLVDNLRILHVEDAPGRFRDVPDEAIDKHTPRGKRLGRDIVHFVEEGSKLVPEGLAYSAEWDRAVREEAERLMLALWGPGAKPREEPPADGEGERSRSLFD